VEIRFLPLLVAAAVSAAAGVYFLTWGARGRRTAAAFQRTAVGTTAEVTDLRLRHQSHNREHDDGYWVPVVRFALPDGRIVETETRVGSMPAPARVGETVEVRYDPDDPRRVDLRHGAARSGSLGCLWSGLGAGALLLAAVLLVAWFLLARVLGVPG
jgi:hypothetical protein